MVAFLNTSKAYATIEEIIDKATTEVFLISPYIRFPKPLLERLKYKDGLGIRTTVVCREKDINKDLGSQVRSDLKQLKNLELRFDDDLHAKCFYNQESMVITSLNLLESSERKNREMGVLLSLKDDPLVFKEALNEAQFIVSNSRKDSLIGNIARSIAKEAKAIVDSSKNDKPSRGRTTRTTKAEGHCIRCNTNIHYNQDKPYCLNCFRLWKKSGSHEDYKEKYCHLCGKQINTTKEYPLCRNCYRGIGKQK